MTVREVRALNFLAEEEQLAKKVLLLTQMAVRVPYFLAEKEQLAIKVPAVTVQGVRAPHFLAQRAVAAQKANPLAQMNARGCASLAEKERAVRQRLVTWCGEWLLSILRAARLQRPLPFLDRRLHRLHGEP